MNQNHFQDFIKRIYNAYGRVYPKGEIVEFLWSKLGNLPSGCMEWVEDRFLSRNENFPTKVHLAILACWYDWLNEHPEHKAKSTVECPYCQDGMLYLGRYEPMHGRVTTYTANCGHCRQRADEKSVPMMTRDQAVKRGYSILSEEGRERDDSRGGSMWHTVASDAIAGNEPVDERRADLR